MARCEGEGAGAGLAECGSAATASMVDAPAMPVGAQAVLRDGYRTRESRRSAAPRWSRRGCGSRFERPVRHFGT